MSCCVNLRLILPFAIRSLAASISLHLFYPSHSSRYLQKIHTYLFFSQLQHYERFNLRHEPSPSRHCCRDRPPFDRSRARSNPIVPPPFGPAEQLKRRRRLCVPPSLINAITSIVCIYLVCASRRFVLVSLASCHRFFGPSIPVHTCSPRPYSSVALFYAWLYLCLVGSLELDCLPSMVQGGLPPSLAQEARLVTLLGTIHGLTGSR